MELYIFRHGFAPMHPGADFGRELGEKGRVEVAKSAALLKDVCFELAICSPLVRAVQTAELIKETIELPEHIEIWPEAGPAGEPARLLNRLELSPANTTLLVSHQPLVSDLVDFLSGERIYMGTAAVLGIRMDVIGAHCGTIFFRGLN